MAFQQWSNRHQKIDAILQAKRPKEEAERVKSLLEKADLVKICKVSADRK